MNMRNNAKLRPCRSGKSKPGTTRLFGHSNGRNRTGGVMALFLVAIPVLLAAVAFAIDIGNIASQRTELQNAVDAGSLAAQLQMRTDPDNVEKAKRIARQFVKRNQGGMKIGGNQTIDIEAGRWDSASESFDANADSSSQNAIRVAARKNKQPFIFGTIMGHKTFSVPGEAIASGATSSLDIMLTLDLSGSMLYQGRIEALRAAAPVFVEVIDELGDNIQVGVMGLSANPSSFNQGRVGPRPRPYNSGLHSTPSHHVGVMEHKLTSDLPSLNRETLTTENLRASKYNGWTGTGAALGDSVHYLINGAEARSGARKIVVIMTDGHANRPPSNGPGYARQMAAYADENDVNVYTISLGNSADEGLNQDIADTTGGEHFLANGSNVTELTEALTNAFRDVAKKIKRTHLVK